MKGQKSGAAWPAAQTGFARWTSASGCWTAWAVGKVRHRRRKPSALAQAERSIAWECVLECVMCAGAKNRSTHTPAHTLCFGFNELRHFLACVSSVSGFSSISMEDTTIKPSFN